MEFNEYQDYAKTLAIYPPEAKITYPLLGLIGEVGEFANKYKKVIRDGREFNKADMESELGDVLWYLQQVASDADISLQDIATGNLDKLFDRRDRGMLGGSGDKR